MALQNKGWVTEEELDKALKGMILSASGWRLIFAADGNGESKEPAISPAHRLIVAAAARVFTGLLNASPSGGPSLVLVGTDTRPTGPAIADAAIAALLAAGCQVRYAGVVAAPEIMAWARGYGLSGDPNPDPSATGFLYISASHNPIGHNGIKFGLTDGGVLGGTEAATLIRAFKDLSAAPASGEGRIKALQSLQDAPGRVQIEKVYLDTPFAKKEAYKAYFDFTAQVAYGGHVALQKAITRGLEAHPLKLVCDFNGSARALSVDREFLAGLGLPLEAINETPGGIAHRIVPEGESLEPCRIFLEECHRKDQHFLLGYVPDCDGDRGNLVIWDDAAAKARILEAQEVFALCCVAELAHLVWTEEAGSPLPGSPATGSAAPRKIAIVVNDPTSMRVDRIAQAFGAEVFRAEVGEANVVGLARKLRERGYIVRVLGEGSAGGNITHPSAVRDPLDTLLSLVKLLCVRGDRGFFSIWLQRSGREYRDDFTLSDVIASLPPFATTGVYEKEALLQVKSTDHGALKNRYQTVFLREWEIRKDLLREKYGIESWEAAAYKGMEERRGVTCFGDAGQGGLKIQFLNKAALPIAAIWMRGSATEPVFRIMADAEGKDNVLERDLIFWQRRMVAEADEAEEAAGRVPAKE